MVDAVRIEKKVTTERSWSTKVGEGVVASCDVGPSPFNGVMGERWYIVQDRGLSPVSNIMVFTNRAEVRALAHALTSLLDAVEAEDEA